MDPLIRERERARARQKSRDRQTDRQTDRDIQTVRDNETWKVGRERHTDTK